MNAEPRDAVMLNMVQIIQYLRQELNMSDISIMQLFHIAFANSLQALRPPKVINNVLE